jgi:hypothetical protein
MEGIGQFPARAVKHVAHSSRDEAEIDPGERLRHRLPVSTLTIEISDDLAARLAAASEGRQVSPAQIVQEALANALPATSTDLPEGKTLYDVLVEAGALGCFDSGRTDLATNPEHMKGYGAWRR